MILVYPLELLLNGLALVLCGNREHRRLAYAGACCAALTIFLYAAPKYVIVVDIPAIFLPMIALALHYRAYWFSFGVASGAGFTAGWAVASLFRQIVFELATVGHLTAAIDACTVQLAPFGMLLVAVATLPFGAFLSLLYRINPSVPPLGVRIGILIGFALLGAYFGAHSWSDWEVQHPCF